MFDSKTASGGMKSGGELMIVVNSPRAGVIETRHPAVNTMIVLRLFMAVLDLNE